jgi:hypothetical protein
VSSRTRRHRARPRSRPHARAPFVAACLFGAGVAAAALATPPERAAHPGSQRPPVAADTPATSGEVRAAAARARGFLEDYVRYLRGALDPSQISAVTPALRSALARQAVHPSRVARRRGARVAELRTEIDDAGQARASARVLDGADTTLGISLTLQRTGAGWEVSDVTTR